MAQPSLSEQIRRLEAELGVPLFVRAGRGLELTEAGRLLRPQAERTLAAAQEARRVRARGARAHRRHRVASARSAARTTTCSPASCRTSASATRTCACALVGQNSAEVADAVREGQLEAGLIVLPIDDRGLDVAPGDPRGDALHLAPTPSASREPMTIERLAEAPLILYDARFGGRTRRAASCASARSARA